MPTNPKPDANRRANSREPSRDVLTPAEAAARLGVTADAVRVRLRRGTLPGEKIGGEWFAHLPRETVRETSREPSRLPDADLLAVVAAKDAALDHAEREIDWLRGELSGRSRELAAERERSDTLQRIALDRLESLTAGNAPESPQTAQDAPKPTSATAPAHSSPEPVRRPWWAIRRR